jgi:HK97 family phage prohead protease
MTRDIETRSSTLTISGDTGEFEGYIAVWDTIDSYNSEFVRGSFKKTINERSQKIKVLYNHDKLIGRAVDVREDDYGVFAKGRINLDIELGRDVHALMKAGDLDGLSFAFQVYSDEYKSDGLRTIKEVRLLEFGPVDFPANDHALITGVRARNIENTCLRSFDYESVYSNMWMDIEPEIAIDTLKFVTFDIIHDPSIEDKKEALNAMLNSFSNVWADHVMKSIDELQKSAFDELRSAGGVETVAMNTNLTTRQIREALSGKITSGNFNVIGENFATYVQKTSQSAADALLANFKYLTNDQKRSLLDKLDGVDAKPRQSIANIWNTNL